MQVLKNGQGFICEHLKKVLFVGGVNTWQWLQTQWSLFNVLLMDLPYHCLSLSIWTHNLIGFSGRFKDDLLVPAGFEVLNWVSIYLGYKNHKDGDSNSSQSIALSVNHFWYNVPKCAYVIKQNTRGNGQNIHVKWPMRTANILWCIMYSFESFSW